MSGDRAGVPLSQPLGRGTVGQSPFGRDTRRDGGGTADLKALARKVFERDSRRDANGTVGERGVPRPLSEWDTWDTPKTDLDRSAGSPPAQTPANAPRTSQPSSPLSDGPHAHSDSLGDSAESRLPLIPDPDAFEERAALVEYGAGVPREWAEGFARLDLAQPPKGFDERRWRTLIDDGGKFLDRWGGEAARLGWSALDVFGAHPIAPGARYDAAGLVLLIDGGEVIAIRLDRATIRSRLSPSELTYLRTPKAGVVALWDL